MCRTTRNVMNQWHSRLPSPGSLRGCACARQTQLPEIDIMYPSKQLFHKQVLIALLLCLQTSIYGDKCQQKLARPELSGFRCVTASEVYTDIIGIEQHMCIYLCVSRNDCSIVNYNTEQNTCHLSNDPCVALQGDEVFQVNFLGVNHRNECLQWLPSSTLDDSATISSPRCHPDEVVCHVGRLVSSSNVLPGTYRREEDTVWSMFNGDDVITIDSSSIKEILDVRTGCQLTWMPFSAGDAIPVGAVERGFLASNGATLYVIRADAGYLVGVFGYYDPESEIGFVPRIGDVVEMELLVLL